MFSRNILQTQVSDKIKLLAFESFVNDVFIKALPFKSSNLNDQSKKALTEYCMITIESMGGYNALLNALDHEKDPQKRILLLDINNICTEAANKVAKRVTEDNENKSKDDTSMEEIVAGAGFTKEELNDFIKKGEAIDTERLADIVKDKVIAVLKDEKEYHKKVDEINDELNDNAITINDEDESNDDDTSNDELVNDSDEKDDDGSVEESVSSFINLALHGKKNEHISFFSAIQNAACEQIMITENTNNLDPNEVSLRRLKNITFNNTLNIFNNKPSLISTLENLSSIQSAEIQEQASENMDKVTEATMVDSVIIYTLLESLHTMNIINPSVSDMKHSVDYQLNYSQKGRNEKRTLAIQLEQAISESKKISLRNNKDEIDKCIETFENIKDRISSCVESCIDDKLLNQLNQNIEFLKEKYNAINIVTESVTESFFSKRQHEGNVAQMIKVKTLLKSVTNPKCIIFEQYPDTNVLSVAAESYTNTAKTHITLEGYTGNINDFKNIFNDSILMSENIPEVYLSIKDGSGTRIRIK